MLALRRFTEGVSPKGSWWSVLELPDCLEGTSFSGAAGFDCLKNGYGFQFPPVIADLWTKIAPMFSGISPNNPDGKNSKWTYWDKVKVPSDLPTGRYVLGWRW